MQTRESGPAQFVLALVGPRPNCSLCSRTMAFETSIRTLVRRSSEVGTCCSSVDMLATLLSLGAVDAQVERRKTRAITPTLKHPQDTASAAPRPHLAGSAFASVCGARACRTRLDRRSGPLTPKSARPGEPNAL